MTQPTWVARAVDVRTEPFPQAVASSGPPAVVALVPGLAQARRNLQLLLERRGGAPIAVTEFDAGPCLVGALAAGRHVDLVVADLSMLGLDGWRDIERLRAVGYRGPVIAHSASMDEPFADIRGLDVQAVIQREATYDELVEAITVQLGRSEGISTC